MLLQKWRDVTERMYPGRADLLVPETGLPEKSGLTLDKLGEGGGVMTDGCDKAHKERRIVVQMIKEKYLALGRTPDSFKVFELDCWDHARNVWFGAATRHLSA